MPTSGALGERYEHLVQARSKAGVSIMSAQWRAGLRLMEETEQRRQLEPAASPTDIDTRSQSNKRRPTPAVANPALATKIRSQWQIP